MRGICWSPGPQFNIKMSSCQYRKSHCGDKTVIRSFYLHNGISFTFKTTSLYWIRALIASLFHLVNLTNARWLPIRCSGTYFNEVLFENLKFSFSKMHPKVSSLKWCPSCLCFNVLSASLMIWLWSLVIILLASLLASVRTESLAGTVLTEKWDLIFEYSLYFNDSIMLVWTWWYH